MNFNLDEESYFTLSNSTVVGNDGYYSCDPKNASPDLKYKRKAKHESKVVIWLAISPTGMTRPVIKQSGYSVNKNTKKIAFKIF